MASVVVVVNIENCYDAKTRDWRRARHGITRLIVSATNWRPRQSLSRGGRALTWGGVPGPGILFHIYENIR